MRLGLVLFSVALLLAACGSDETAGSVMPDAMPEGPSFAADVVAVAVSGAPGAYRFEVTVSSPDTGCDRYADWWEVLSADGALLYRRTVLHSHVDEQPFSRSSGPVAIDAARDVIVRAHMSLGGYGGAALRGSVGAGFSPVALPANFAAGVESIDPQPPDCAF